MLDGARPPFRDLCVCVSPVLLCLLVNGFSVALALEVQLAVLEPKELEDRDLPRLSELTFLVLLVAVLLQSTPQRQNRSIKINRSITH